MGKFLNEENYQRTKKKLSLIALIILVAGLVIGGALIIGGVAKINNSKNSDKIATLKEEIIVLEEQKDDEFFSNGMTAEWRRLDNQLQDKIKELNKIESKTGAIFMCFGGGSIILFSGVGALAMLVFIKRREIASFATQQMMPVMQEGIDVMAPTIGSAAGTIAGEVTRAVRKAKKDVDNNQ